MKDNKNKKQETQNREIEDQEVDNRSLGDKFEDGLDNVFGGIQDAIYGENPNFQEDIPATRELDSGRRVVNKVQTQKNISKKVVRSKFGKGLFIILGIGAIIALIYWILNAILMA